MGISRPTLIKLLQGGEIPFERPGAGRHRRVRLQDIIGYQRRRKVERRATLAALTADAATDGLYSGEPTYADALKAARKKRG